MNLNYFATWKQATIDYWTNYFNTETSYFYKAVEPLTSTKIYDGTFPISGSTILKAKAFKNYDVSPRVDQHYSVWVNSNIPSIPLKTDTYSGTEIVDGWSINRRLLTWSISSTIDSWTSAFRDQYLSIPASARDAYMQGLSSGTTGQYIVSRISKNYNTSGKYVTGQRFTISGLPSTVDFDGSSLPFMNGLINSLPPSGTSITNVAISATPIWNYASSGGWYLKYERLDATTVRYTYDYTEKVFGQNSLIFDENPYISELIFYNMVNSIFTLNWGNLVKYEYKTKG